MLETVRQYADERLESAGESAGTVRLHAACFTELAESAMDLGRHRRGEAMDLLELDYANLRLALQRAIRQSQTGIAERIARSLAEYWWSRGSLTEADELLSAVLVLPSGDDLLRRGRVLDKASTIAILRGDYARAAKLGRDAIQVLEEAGDPESLGVALSNLGGAFAFQPDRVEEGVVLLERAIAIHESLGNRERLASAVLNLANAYMGMASYREAEAAYREGRSIADECGDLRWAASAVLGIGECAYWLGDLEQAHALLLDATRQGADLRDNVTVLSALDPLAIVACALGDDEEGLRVRAAVDATAGALGHRLDPLYDEPRARETQRARDRIGENAAAIENEASSWSLDDAVSRITARSGQPKIETT